MKVEQGVLPTAKNRLTGCLLASIQCTQVAARAPRIGHQPDWFFNRMSNSFAGSPY